MPGAVGGTLGGGGIPRGSPEKAPEERVEHMEHIGRCKKCGKETELVDGYCAECKWEIEIGERRPVLREKKHHFWSHDKTESLPTPSQSKDDSGTSPDE